MGDNLHYFMAGVRVILSYVWSLLRKSLLYAGVFYISVGSVFTVAALLNPDPISENLKVMIFGLPGFVITLLLIAYSVVMAVVRLGESRVREESRDKWKEKAVGKW